MRARFIPAGAGNTRHHVDQQDGGAVHPRGCGEHSTIDVEQGFSGGSSPRVRGTPPGHGPARSCGRFIPAGAGNTLFLSTPSCRFTVHPRGCGEHCAAKFWIMPSVGSSPRVRGTPAERSAGRQTGRFIPAGAGNTVTPLYRSSGKPVHPRGCGEHATALPGLRCGRGSSPRVRGTRRGL